MIELGWMFPSSPGKPGDDFAFVGELGAVYLSSDGTIKAVELPGKVTVYIERGTQNEAGPAPDPLLLPHRNG